VEAKSKPIKDERVIKKPGVFFPDEVENTNPLLPYKMY
jgi:hypothetical protein